MADQKIDNLLNLAMDATPEERRKSENLNIGYDMTSRQWDIIVKYSGPERGLAGNGIQVVPLLGGYAVVTLPESEIDAYSDRVQVEFIEKPKRLYFELFQAKGASCIRTVQTGRDGLTGKGILIGIVDSGVDYFHPDLRAGGRCGAGTHFHIRCHCHVRRHPGDLFSCCHIIIDKRHNLFTGIPRMKIDIVVRL